MANNHDGNHASTFHRMKGRLKRSLGWLTADRRVEAAGEAEARMERLPDESEIQRAEHLVKHRYGETPDHP
jgi:uncharacterized protein YjbJ (UPF0337 family)